MINNERFKVSICMITYNHEKFIAQAIEGIIMQITDFDIELVIGEDCSTDKTRDICLHYKQKYPERITLLLPENNLGMMANFNVTIDACLAGFKYVAMCEGDDYWVDRYKLQKQIDYLEKNKECGLVYTDVKVFDETKQIFIESKQKFIIDETKVVSELIKSKYIEFPTIVVRANLLKKILAILDREWQGKIIGDTRLILEFAQLSKIGYLPEQTTVYRILQGSASHPMSVEKYIFASEDTFITRLNFINRYKLNKKMLGIPVCNFNRGIIQKALEQKNYFNALRLIRKLKIRESFLFCDIKTLRAKYDGRIILQLFATLVGFGVMKNIFAK